ncbi:porin family protein [Brevundimonas sp.]|uniref:porin family protein n=1 Tax=Brevundimonas sp. TaxID=1871086 RepID=UPI00286C330A|nr:porin family protein [Brevundimonas sp.]
MKTTLMALVAACALMPAAAQAQSDSRSYATLGYTAVDTEQSELGAVTGRFGYKVLPWVGAELEAGIGIQDDSFDVTIGGTSSTIELKHDVAAYAVAFLPLGDHFEAFARVGYGTTKIESSIGAVNVRGDGDGESFNYGVGASAFLDGWNGVRVDWTRRDFQDDGGEADTWSVSYIRRF